LKIKNKKKIENKKNKNHYSEVDPVTSQLFAVDCSMHHPESCTAVTEMGSIIVHDPSPMFKPFDAF
jgi:hypothetical protein